MDVQDIRNLQEAYLEVVENQQLDEAEQSPMPPRRSAAERKKRAKELGDRQTIRGIVSGYNKKRQPSRQEDPEKYYPKEQYDLYDIILSHLLDEGYADTQQAAEAIMVNMSEEWREDIVEEVLDEGNRFEREYNVPNWDKVYNRNERDTPRHTRNPERRPSGKLETSNQTTKRVGKQRRQDHVDTRGVKQIPGAKGIRMRFGRAF
jgi:hypothetical protein